MGANSIHSNLSKDDIIADIRLTLSADFKHEKTVIVVEGEDDIVFFNGKLHPDVDIHESFSGKQGVKEIVTFFSDDRVIGICDTDYDQPSQCPQLLYYDFSCLEMMLISKDSVFRPFFYTYYHGKFSPDEVRLQLLFDLRWLSYCRKLSAERDWYIKFNGISITAAFKQETKMLDIPILISQLSRINPGFIENRERLQAISVECRKDCPIEQCFLITQGHDFLHYFQAFCEAVHHTKRKLPGVSELFRSLVCAYRKEDFMDSTLYRSLCEYETTYGLTILLT